MQAYSYRCYCVYFAYGYGYILSSLCRIGRFVMSASAIELRCWVRPKIWSEHSERFPRVLLDHGLSHVVWGHALTQIVLIQKRRRRNGSDRAIRPRFGRTHWLVSVTSEAALAVEAAYPSEMLIWWLLARSINFTDAFDLSASLKEAHGFSSRDSKSSWGEVMYLEQNWYRFSWIILYSIRNFADLLDRCTQVQFVMRSDDLDGIISEIYYTKWINIVRCVADGIWQCNDRRNLFEKQRRNLSVRILTAIDLRGIKCSTSFAPILLYRHEWRNASDVFITCVKDKRTHIELNINNRI